MCAPVNRRGYPHNAFEHLAKTVYPVLLAVFVIDMLVKYSNLTARYILLCVILM